MTKPSPLNRMNRNFYLASLEAWCQTVDMEALTRAILESCPTQIQFRTSDLADGSSEVSAEGSGDS